MLSHGNVYKSCCCMGPYLVAIVQISCWHTDCICETRTWRCNHQRSVRFQLYRCCLRICNLTWSPLRQNRLFWSICEVDQIRNAPYDDRKVNDLHRSFRYLISWRHTWRKLVYRMHTLVVAVCTRGHVAFNANVYVDDIYRFIPHFHATVVVPTLDLMKILIAIQWCEMKFTR